MLGEGIVTSKRAGLAVWVSLFLFVGCTDSNTTEPNAAATTHVSEIAGGGTLSASRHASDDIEEALDHYYEGYDVSFKLLKVVSVGRVAFGYVHVDREDESFRSFGTFSLSDGSWVADGFGLDPVLPDAPRQGSGQVSLGVASSVRAQQAMWGLVDPSLTRIEVVTEDAELLDADIPTEDGATIVLFDQSASSVRLFRDGRFVKSVPLTDVSQAD